jgi:nicotinamidase-related amidase
MAAMARSGIEVLDRAASQLLVVDIQAKLIPTIHAVEAMVARARFVIDTARALGVPITLTEQYPKGLGPTDAELRAACGEESRVFAKTAFSCLKDEGIAAHLAAHEARKQLVVVGMEAHVCVLQTALDAASAGYQVFVVGDAISSRAAADVEAAKQRMAAAWVTVVTAEMVFFEWLERSGTPEFKQLSPILR